MIKKSILLIICFVFFTISIFALDTVIYPQSQSASDTRFYDLLEILEMSLEKTKDEYGEYNLKASRIIMNELRVIHEIQKGKEVNLMWRTADSEIEEKLIPIYIPTRKGIIIAIRKIKNGL